MSGKTSVENEIIVSYVLFLYDGRLVEPFTELYNNDYSWGPLRCQMSPNISTDKMVSCMLAQEKKFTNFEAKASEFC